MVFLFAILQAKLGHVGPREVVHEVLGDRMINSASWRKKKRTSTWTAQETDYFYEVSHIDSRLFLLPVADSLSAVRSVYSSIRNRF